MDVQQQILDELRKLNKGTTGTAQVGTGSTAFTTSIGDMAGKMFAPLGAAAKGVSEGFDKVRSIIEPNLTAFRELSKTGSNFSNDVVGMAVAVKKTGLELGEFTDLIAKNGVNFAGLGGSVARGSEAFAKLSEGLRTSDMAEYMRQAGMTNKELNDVMAIQIGFMRTSMRDNKQRDSELIDRTGKLAAEMDLMAKLTGKTREEQADAMRKAQADMQVEAKLRLIGIKEGPEAEAKARAAFAEQYNQAQLRGQGQMFKEVFATGTVLSQEARMQSALLGKEAQATSEQARATAKGNIEDARKFNQIAQEEAIKNNKNAALMTVATFGEAGGQASKTIMDSMKSQQTFRDSIESIRKEAEFKNKSEKEIIAEADRRVKASQAGQDEQGKSVSGATKAIISLGARADDVNAALYNKLVLPLNEQIGPQLGAFTSRYLGLRVSSGEKFQNRVESAISGENKDNKPESFTDIAKGKGRSEFFGEGLVSEISGLVRETATLVEKAVLKMNTMPDGSARNPNARNPNTNNTNTDTTTSPRNPNARNANRDLGTFGMTGGMFEPEDFYGKVAKGETVMTPGQLNNLVQGIGQNSFTSGMQSALQKNAGMYQSREKMLIDALSKTDTNTPTKQASVSAAPIAETGLVMAMMKQSQFSNTTEKSPGGQLAQEFNSMMKSQNTLINNLSAKDQSQNLENLMKSQNTLINNLSAKDQSQNLENLMKTFAQDNTLTKTPIEPVSLDNNLRLDLNRMSESLKNTQLENKFQNMSRAPEFKPESAANTTNQTAKEENTDNLKAQAIRTDASLNDVVSSLDKLNTKIAQLNETFLDVGSRQIRAVKSNNKNLYERA